MKLNRLSIPLLALATAFTSCSKDKAHKHDEMNTETTNEMKKHQHFSYLTMNGEFKIDPTDTLTVNDKRNPSRVLLSTTTEKGTLTKMSFYDHDDENKLIAECGYKYIGSKPDPHYYPHASKTSIWDIFEKVEDYAGEECDKFKYVISRSPHDEPIHMHLRYGNDPEELLNMSKNENDSWWAELKGVTQK